MSLKLGGSKKKWSNTSESTQTSARTPVVPDWAAGPVQRGAGQVASLFDLDPGALVAPSHALQAQAATTAASLGGGNGADQGGAGTRAGLGDASWLSPLMGADTPFASGGKAYNYLGQYMDPYLEDVVDASAADFNVHAGKVRAQQDLDLAGAGAFGGSGAALTRSGTEGELARARAATLSGLRSKGWESALGAAQGDAERATRARIANAETALQDRAQKAGFGFKAQEQALAADASQRANATTQAQIGEMLRGVDQQQRAAPVTTAQQIIAMLQGLPLGLFTGQSETSTKHDTASGKEKQQSLDLSAGLQDVVGLKSMPRGGS